MTNFFELMGASFFFVFLLMVICWATYLFKNIAAIADIGFGIGFFLTAWIIFFLGDGAAFRILIVTLMVSAWSARLVYHLMYRIKREGEDPRYIEMRQLIGPENIHLKFFIYFTFQTFIVIILSFPFFLIGSNPNPELSLWEGVGFLVWAIGLLGEAYADLQLELFKKNPENQEKVCNQGLWRFSRHPNYFFEWVIWVGYALFAIGSPFGWLGLISPILMYLLLNKVSGIPLTEKQALKKRGDAYLAYQKKTSAFFPWF